MASVAELLPGVRAVCDHLLRQRHADGTIGRLAGWAVADWCPQWNRPEDGHGAPPGSGAGTCAFSNLMGIATWKAGLALHQALLEDPGPLPGAVDACIAATHARYFDAGRGLYRDMPEGAIASAYTNVWAILAGMPGDHGALAERIVQDPTLCELTMFSWYFACRALSSAGRYHLYGERQRLWREMLEWGFTTCPETVDFVHTRSDCHAWSATPLIEFGREILGVRPAAPGYAPGIRIEPKPRGPDLGPRHRPPARRLSCTSPSIGGWREAASTAEARSRPVGRWSCVCRTAPAGSSPTVAHSS